MRNSIGLLSFLFLFLFFCFVFYFFKLVTYIGLWLHWFLLVQFLNVFRPTLVEWQRCITPQPSDHIFLLLLLYIICRRLLRQYILSGSCLMAFVGAEGDYFKLDLWRDFFLIVQLLYLCFAGVFLSLQMCWILQGKHANIADYNFRHNVFRS